MRVHQGFVAEAPPTPQSHASTLVEGPHGLVAAWFGGTREGHPDVVIWTARQEGAGWSRPEPLGREHDEAGRPVPCWNPVLHAEGDGGLLLFFKAGPSPRRWWGLWRRSRDGGRSWSPAARLPAGHLGPVKNKPLRLDDGRLLCGSSTEGLAWRVHCELARDPAGPWERGQPLNRGLWLRAIQPTFLSHGGGRLQMLCRTRSRRIAESWSEDGGATWSPLRLTALPDAASGLDALTLRDGRHVLVYNHSRRGRSPLNLAFSRDGRRWHAGAVLESGAGEYSYPAVIQDREGRIHVTYTWRRRRIAHAVLEAAAEPGAPIVAGSWPDAGSGI